MRGHDEQTNHMFRYLSPEQWRPADHPLRAVQVLTDQAPRSLSRRFAQTERPSIPPELGILKLAHKFGPRRLEAACARAVQYDDRDSRPGAERHPDYAPLVRQAGHRLFPIPRRWVMQPNHQLMPKLKNLRLSGILATLEVRTQQAITEKLSYVDFLERLVEDEVERRAQKTAGAPAATRDRGSWKDTGRLRFHGQSVGQPAADLRSGHVSLRRTPRDPPHSRTRRRRQIASRPSPRARSLPARLRCGLCVRRPHAGPSPRRTSRRDLRAAPPDAHAPGRADPRRLRPQAVAGRRPRGLLRGDQRTVRARGTHHHLELRLQRMAGSVSEPAPRVGRAGSEGFPVKWTTHSWTLSAL